MGKCVINIIGGGNNIGSIAIGKGAVAVGSVNVATPEKKTYSPIKCDYCGAAQNPQRKTCKYCGTEYSASKNDIGAISISVEDES